MFTARVIASRAIYAVSCLAAAVLLVASGYAHKAVGQITGLAEGIAISGASIGASAGSSVGAMNILLMGLESRTNFQGQTLSSQLLTAMHAGSVYGVNNLGVGSQDTNTLILVHIFAGGQKAVGFSLPRDELVTYPQEYYPGVTRGKIDGAYYFAYAYFLNQNPSMASAERYLRANQAGEAAAIATVESVTGQHIDHFVETNLAGFFYLAGDFGGLEVCIKPAPAQGGFAAGANLTDMDTLVYPHTDNSGFNAYGDGYNRKKGGSQYLHLSPAQSLAYVRSRDTLPGVDIGRTHRQQAVLDYVIWKLKHEGAFTDLSTISALLGDAKQYVITDSNLNLLDFSTDMRALTGKGLSFQTLPGTPENGVELNGTLQDVIAINVPHIRALVQNTFYPPSALAPAPAAKEETAPRAAPGRLTRSGPPPVSGPSANASSASTPSASAPSGRAEAVSGRAAGTVTPAPGSTAGTGNGAVTVTASAPYGIPCVY